MNTYGLFSINSGTFNTSYKYDYSYPKQTRDKLVTILRVHNLAFDILGYIPAISFYSGCARMASGFAFCAVTLAAGDLFGDRGMIIGVWYLEAIGTGLTQIARGAIEAFIPFGRVVNLAIGGVVTLKNHINEKNKSAANYTRDVYADDLAPMT